MSEAEEIRLRRQELQRFWGVAYGQLNAILFAEDPAEINFEYNTDEYEPVVETILPRLRSCRSIADVRGTVHQEFCRCFDDAETVGPPERYQRIAERIWTEVLPILPPEG